MSEHLTSGLQGLLQDARIRLDISNKHNGVGSSRSMEPDQVYAGNRRHSRASRSGSRQHDVVGKPPRGIDTQSEVTQQQGSANQAVLVDDTQVQRAQKSINRTRKQSRGMQYDVFNDTPTAESYITTSEAFDHEPSRLRKRSDAMRLVSVNGTQPQHARKSIGSNLQAGKTVDSMPEGWVAAIFVDLVEPAIKSVLNTIMECVLSVWLGLEHIFHAFRIWLHAYIGVLSVILFGFWLMGSTTRDTLRSNGLAGIDLNQSLWTNFKHADHHADTIHPSISTREHKTNLASTTSRHGSGILDPSTAASADNFVRVHTSLKSVEYATMQLLIVPQILCNTRDSIQEVGEMIQDSKVNNNLVISQICYYLAMEIDGTRICLSSLLQNIIDTLFVLSAEVHELQQMQKASRTSGPNESETFKLNFKAYLTKLDLKLSDIVIQANSCRRMTATDRKNIPNLQILRKNTIRELRTTLFNHWNWNPFSSFKEKTETLLGELQMARGFYYPDSLSHLDMVINQILSARDLIKQMEISSDGDTAELITKDMPQWQLLSVSDDLAKVARWLNDSWRGWSPKDQNSTVVKMDHALKKNGILESDQIQIVHATSTMIAKAKIVPTTWTPSGGNTVSRDVRDSSTV